MKLCDKIQKGLQAHYKEVIVHDSKGDGHFIQIVCIDDLFEGQGLVARTRTINHVIVPWQDLVHAWSAKGFTTAEWKERKNDFEFQQYKHYPKN